MEELREVFRVGRVVVAEAGRMPRFMSDEEYENEKGDVEAVAAKADAFIQDLQGQLEAEKAATADLEEKLHTVVLLLPGFTSMAMAIAWVLSFRPICFPE